MKVLNYFYVIACLIPKVACRVHVGFSSLILSFVTSLKTFQIDFAWIRLFFLKTLYCNCWLFTRDINKCINYLLDSVSTSFHRRELRSNAFTFDLCTQMHTRQTNKKKKKKTLHFFSTFLFFLLANIQQFIKRHCD